MFCVFIDFEKSLNTVWTEGLRYKLLMNHINSTMRNVKSRITYDNEFSEILHAGTESDKDFLIFLSSLYLNDLETFLENNNVTGLKTLSDELEQELGYYVKLFVIMNANDTALVAKSASNLQNRLNLFQENCIKWKLKVNIDKTKMMISFKGRLPTNIHFKYGDKEFEIVKDFLYLGIKFGRSGSFNSNAKTKLVNMGTKAMYELLRRGRLHNLSIQCQLELFDSMVKPIILYECETWGFGNNEIIERLHLKLCKLLLHLKTSAPDYMVYGQLGRYLFRIDI
jgi:hypothetical protein